MHPFKFFLLPLLTTLVLAACATTPAAEPPVAETPTTPTVAAAPASATVDAAGLPFTIQDRLGRELTFEQPPQRVVCYYNDCYGILASLNFKPVAQAVNPEMLTDPIYFDGTGETIQTLRREGESIDLEAVAAVQPDLVFVWSEEEVAALDGIAPAFASLDPANLEELYAVTESYGRLLGQAEAAAAAITRFQQRYQAYQQRAPKDLSVLKLGIMDDQKFYISTVDDPICQILNTVAICQWEKSAPDEFWGYETTLEGVLQLDPDVIIANNWSSADRTTLEAMLAENPLWNELRAVQTNRVLSTPGYENPIASSLPAATKFLDTYLPLLYPDVFPGPLTDDQVQEILGETASADAEFPLTITDGAKRELTFTAPPQRVVCLYNRCAQELAFVEVNPVAVGAPWTYNVALDPVNFGAAAANFGQVTQDPEINWEQVASFRPDLIIGDAEMTAAAEGMAPLYSLSWNADDFSTLDGFLSDVRNYARIFGKSAAVEAKIQAVLDRVAAYAARSPKDKSLLVIYLNEDGSVVWIPPDCGLFLSQLVECGNPGSAEWIEGSMETLLSFDPEVLIVEQYSVTDEAALLERLNERDPLWQELSAVKAGQVHLVPVSQARINTIQSVRGAVDALMPLVYPDLFPAPLTDEEVQEILAEGQ